MAAGAVSASPSAAAADGVARRWRPRRAPRPYGARSAWRADAGWLAPLLLFFVAKGLLLVAVVGPFTGHDEVDHYHYVTRLADGDGLGVVGEVQLPAWAERYQEYVADYPNNAEVIQPPLYHLLLAPLAKAVPGGVGADLYVLRTLSVALGAVTVWVAYLTARLLFPREALVRAGVPVFVAFQPQFAFEAAIVNHDILVIVLFTAAVHLTLRGLRDGFGRRRALALGLLAAAGLWTKTSFGLVLPAVALGIGLAWWDRVDRWGSDRRALRALAERLALAVALPLLLVVPWFVRSYRLYGDPTGAQRLREIPEYGDQASTYRAMLTSKEFWQGRLEDFWGNYGWRQVPFDPVEFQTLWVVWGLAGIGLAAVALRAAVGPWVGRRPVLDRFQRRGLGLLALSVACLIFGVLYVGTIQFTQSRFAFPGMVGFATLTLVGWAAWLPARARPAALPVVVVGLMALNAVVTLRFLIPFYFGPGGGALIDP